MSTSTRTVFITGSSSGTGLASAKLFYEQGWNVAATMRTPSKDTELRDMDQSRMLVLPLDVSDIASIQSAIHATTAKFGAIDLLLNNAGYSQQGIFESVTREQIQAQFDVNVFGVMDVTRAALPHLRANPNGAGIINVGSGSGITGYPMLTIYAASKFALEGFTESLSYELGALNIFVKSIIPHGIVTSTSFISTGMSKFAPGGEEVAAYAPFTQRAMQYYGTMGEETHIPASELAKVIFRAATDGKDTLRYYIGNRSVIGVRYDTKDDEEYMDQMRAIFNVGTT